MSGKAPPTGPRALLGTQAGSSAGPGSSSSSLPSSAHGFAQQPQPHFSSSRAPQSSLPSSSTSRIGAVPPTGPRSLQQGNHHHSRFPPAGPKHVNGHSSSGGSNGHSSYSGPSNRQSMGNKGKWRDNGPNAGSYQNRLPSYSQSSPRPDSGSAGLPNGMASSSGSSHKPQNKPLSPVIPATPSGGLKSDRPTVHIAIQAKNPVRDRPSLGLDASPPPPPPPAYDPPPPPPSSPPPPPPTTEVIVPLPPPLPLSESRSSSPPTISPPPPASSLPVPLPPTLAVPPPSESLPRPTTPNPTIHNSDPMPLPPPSVQELERSPSPVIIPPPEPSRPISLPPRPVSPPSRASHSRESPSRHRRSETPSPTEPPRLYEYILPSWPPPQSDYPENLRSYRVIFDPAVDALPPSSSSYILPIYPPNRGASYYRSLIEFVRKNTKDPADVQERIKGKGKGKETLIRYEGEIAVSDEANENDVKEEAIVIRDPRQDKSIRMPPLIRPAKSEFIELIYDYDSNSTGPPPPTSVLITNIAPLTPTQTLRWNFATHGTITSFEPQIDKENGSALGVLYIKYQYHEEARKCVERENGRKGGLIPGAQTKHGDVEEWKVVFDGDGEKLRAVLKELEERKRKEREEKQRRYVNGNLTSATPMSAGGTPHSGIQSPAPFRKGYIPPLVHHKASNLPPKPIVDEPLPPPKRLPPPVDAPVPTALELARQALREKRNGQANPEVKTKAAQMRAKLAMPMMRMSRSPSPTLGIVHAETAASESKSAADKEKDRQEVVRELAENGFDHVKVQGGKQFLSSVSELAVQDFFEGFPVDKILRDHTGLYVTFTRAGMGHRATALLASKQLSFQSVTLTVCQAPVYQPTVVKTHWEQDELVDEAQLIVIRELKGLLERDISERLIAQDLKKLWHEEYLKKSTAVKQELKPLEKKGLKGLSFRRKVQVEQVKEEAETEAEAEAEQVEEEEEEETEVFVRPKKKRKTEVPKKSARKVIQDDDIESEDEEEDVAARATDTEVTLKRMTSEDRQEEQEEEEPVKKKPKIEKVPVKGKKTNKKTKKAQKAESVAEVIFADSEVFELPAVTQLPPDFLPSRSPTPVVQPKRRKRPPTPPPPSPPPDPIGLGLCEDDEDVFFAKLVLSGDIPTPAEEKEKEPAPPSSSEIQSFRKHLTGSARTEGYYKITHAEKAAYVAQYQARAATAGTAPPIVDEPQPQHVTSSRSNRANARRRAQGLEEINQVQRAMALSKGEPAANELTFKFNQLQTRKKHLRFARSPIHDWGLYAMEKISRGEMVIEYVGEVIRAQVADKREKAYERQGIGSSYLFRIDEDLVVDATKKGNLGRLINHSCDPNCTAKIITINGEKKIVIYAKQEIELGDEITYDYHFPFEQDKIPCLCGSAKCRGFLN